MSSVWEFIKRNRGKIVAGGVIVGGLYVARRALAGPQLESPLHESDYLHAQARRHYVFDSNHRTCDASILELIPTLRGRILLRFDVESLTERLKQADLTTEEKVKLWEQIKVLSFGRILAVGYSYSLLIIALKSQISILAGQICAGQRDASSMADGWWSRLSQLWSGPSGPSNLLVPTVEASAQQLFLQCIQYFAGQGVDRLFDRIHALAAEATSAITLKEMMSAVRLTDLLNDIRRKLEGADYRNFSYLIVPLSANQDAWSLPHKGHLEALLNRLHQVLESEQCQKLTSQLVDSYVSGVVEFCDSHGASGSVPMARLIPTVSDAFHAISSSSFESPAQEALVSPDLHQFCMSVFAQDPVIPVSTKSVD
uniref:Peroxisomal biogenesis factor 3 n=1 Tax=Plectus sambesii TaxID=2011161 RepID=A0A914UJN4_9BILA